MKLALTGYVLTGNSEASYYVQFSLRYASLSLDIS